jgi:aspartate-semialdehyde dehydrogenase
VRIPTEGGHSESVNLSFERNFELDEIREILANTPGIVLEDDPTNNRYPMPVHAHGKDEVFVGRLRRDLSAPNSLNLWIVADNLRKGAATNAVQIAEYLVENHLIS